jgi:hypothetical protein
MTRVVAVILFPLNACLTPCERQRDVALDAAERCGLELDGDTDADDECPEGMAEFAECLTPRFRDAPCGAYDGSDADAARELVDCQADCFRSEGG